MSIFQDPFNVIEKQPFFKPFRNIDTLQPHYLSDPWDDSEIWDDTYIWYDDGAELVTDGGVPVLDGGEIVLDGGV